jgi:hypothetical protein
MSSMDAGLNRNAGIFVRSFYMPVLRPNANERELVLAGRLTTWSFGAMAILMALFYSSWRDLGVFTLMMNFSALVATPYAVPLFWCLIVRRSPDWAAWSTVALCCVVGMFVSLVPGSAWAAGLSPEGFGAWLAWAKVNNYAAITIANAGIGSLWFLGASALRGRAVSPARQAEVKEFFTALRTDIPPTESFEPDHRRHLGIARMCLIYGAFILVLAAFATDGAARLGLLFCAGFMGAVGAAISIAAKRGLARQAIVALAANPQVP